MEETNQPNLFPTELVSLSELKPHPRNYKKHPDDQLQHIIESIRQHGFYRNVVVARDNTILAGHGVVLAYRKMNAGDKVPVIRLNIEPDSSEALKVLAGDNEIGKLAEVDDRALTEILKDIRETDTVGLLGTGFDEMMLTNLVMITRHSSEIKDESEAAQWVGMPEYQDTTKPPKLTISFRNEDDRRQFAEIAESIGLRIDKKQQDSWLTWWPFKERNDLASIRFETVQ